MKAISSRQAKAHAITPTVKLIVTRRDGGRCVYCGAPGLPEAHYISRKRGGLGVPQNILTLCRDCHELYDHGDRLKRDGMREFFADYFKSHYEDWSEDALVYHKEGL